MKCFKVDPRISRDVARAYPCPKISFDWLRKTASKIVESHGNDAMFDIAQYRQGIADAIEGSSFEDIAEPGTGLTQGITQAKVCTDLKHAVVLEIVHLTEIGVSALTLEGVRQEREHRVYLDRMAHTSSSTQGRTLRELDWLRPDLKQYPRRRLKMFLSDGTVELQAIELEPLRDIHLGVTPMGTKIFISRAPIIGGVAYLRNEDVTVLGGGVARLQRVHRLRLFEELERRMEQDEDEAQIEGVSPEHLYLEELFGSDS